MSTADPIFLTYLLEIDGIVRTVGWKSRKGKPARVLRLVETLEDNGLDTVVNAVLRGYEIDREWLNGYFEPETPAEPIKNGKYF